MSNSDSIAEHYGPWALIAGASEGTGRAFALALAASGINCILVARRPQPLTALSAKIRDRTGVECITAALDLSADDALDQIAAVVGQREVGLYVSNAGADPNGAHFLDGDIDSWISLVQRNVLTMMRCCHYFGAQMRARRRGGLLLVGSGACYGGGSFMATYSASKAFELCFGESLWAELRPYHVDVLYLALGTTDTPALRNLLAGKGLPLPPGLASPEEVAAVGLARLPHGPVHNWGQADDTAGYATSSADARRSRILLVDESSKRIFGEQ